MMTSTTRSEQVALVTGAAGGIGRALAVRLAAEGHPVAVVDVQDGASTVEEIRSAGGTAAAFSADLTDSAQIADVVERAAAELGSVSVLVNNAGIYPWFEAANIGLDDWRRIFALNVEAPLFLSQAVIPGMRERGWGRIISITSNSIALQVPGATAYVSSKMALIGLTRGLATELGESGITVNAVAPSIVKTPGTGAFPDEAFDALAQTQSIKRVETPDDLTGIISFLASDDARFITAQTIYVDGGMVRSA